MSSAKTPGGPPSTFARDIVKRSREQQRLIEQRTREKIEEYVKEFQRSIERQAEAGCWHFTLLNYPSEEQREALGEICERHHFDEIVDQEGKICGVSWEHVSC